MKRFVVLVCMSLAGVSTSAIGSAGGSSGSTLSLGEPSATVSGEVDAGVPYFAPTVVEVSSATSADGGRLPDGWWVSRPQMMKVGSALAAKEPASNTGTFLIGMAAGLLVGGAAGAFIVHQANR